MVFNRNRRSGPDAEQIESERDHRMHERVQAGMFQEDDDDPVNLYRELKESGVDETTAYHVRNLIHNQDFLLGNLEKAEVDEAKWLARALLPVIKAMHPPENSIFRGELRQEVTGDPKQNLQPLDDMTQNELFQSIMAFAARVSRSEEGFQQEENSKVYRVSELNDGKDEEKKGGFFT